MLADQSFLPDGGILAYPCCHLYHHDARFQQKQRPITRPSVTILKGRDHLVAATALQAGGGAFVEETHGHVDAHAAVLAHAHEVDMDRRIADGIELHVAGQHALLLAGELDVEQCGLEGPLAQFLHQLLGRDGNQRRRLLVAIDHTGDAAITTSLASGPLPGAAAKFRAQVLDVGHCFLLSCPMQGPPGVPPAFPTNRPHGRQRKPS